MSIKVYQAGRFLSCDACTAREAKITVELRVQKRLSILTLCHPCTRNLLAQLEAAAACESPG